jgi:hypothetical protein
MRAKVLGFYRIDRLVMEYITYKLNVQVGWTPNSAALVAVLCGDYRNLTLGSTKNM